MGTSEVQAVFDVLYALPRRGVGSDKGAHAIGYGPLASVWASRDGGISFQGPYRLAGPRVACPRAVETGCSGCMARIQ